MQTTASRVDRPALIDWYRRNRARSAQLFSLVDERVFYSRPIALRHPFIFYEGHIPAFSFLTINERALGERPVDAAFEHLFQRGIDPATQQAAVAHERMDWPSRDAVAAFSRECDRRVEQAILDARIDNPEVPRLVGAQAVYTALEHEPMHHETLLYIVHQLGDGDKRYVAQEHRDTVAPDNIMVEISAGRATLGAGRDELAFGWDNEFGRQCVDVPGFEISAYPITNGDWLRFVQYGGPIPQFWLQRDGQWFLRAQFDQLPLPRSWPVYVTQRQAADYAAWAGARLPTEAEYHRAAFGAPTGNERPYPWGDAPPSARYGNFDFHRYDPEPVDAHPDGASAWDVHDLIGNGWEWTSTPFAPLRGFEPMASYPQYSADFFDGRHFVMKGASPVTSRELIRRSFRNWFYADYPFAYAKFRVAR